MEKEDHLVDEMLDVAAFGAPHEHGPVVSEALSRRPDPQERPMTQLEFHLDRLRVRENMIDARRRYQAPLKRLHRQIASNETFSKVSRVSSLKAAEQSSMATTVRTEGKFAT